MGEEELKDILNKMYLEDRLSTNDIVSKFKETYDLDVSGNVVYLLLKEFGVQLRSISESVSMATRTLDYSVDYLAQDPLMKEVIDGLLISDASISHDKKAQYHRFSMSSSQEEFIKFSSSFIKELAPYLYDREALGKSRGNKGYEKKRFSFSTASHPSISKERIRWYRDGKKIIPKDIRITPMMLKMWYYGDGSIVTNKNSNTCVVRLSTDGFDTKDIEFLVEQLDLQAGIKSKNSDGRIKLKTESIPTFFNFIGRKSDLECYSYKFDVDEWRFWKPMKKVSKELGIPYNRLNHLVGTKSVECNRSPGGKKVMFSESQIEKLKSLHEKGLLEADPRKNSAAVTKGVFQKEPETNTKYNEVFDNGFPYVELTQADKVMMFNRLKNIPTIPIKNKEIIVSFRDNDLAINYHPHLFDVKAGSKKTPVEAFNTKRILLECVEKMLKKNETLTPSNIRRKLCDHYDVKRTSVFPVRVAKTLISEYGKDNMKILDPCAGYSSRLLGFYGCPQGGEYHGIDPCEKTYNGLNKTIEEIGGFSDNHKAYVYKECAEEYMPKLNKEYDMIFTSPPYFDLEKYSDEESQSYIKYPTYKEWLDGFLFKLIEESNRLLKDDGVFLLNISNIRELKVIEHTEVYLKSFFRIENVLLMVSQSQWHDSITEPIFILRKK